MAHEHDHQPLGMAIADCARRLGMAGAAKDRIILESHRGGVEQQAESRDVRDGTGLPLPSAGRVDRRGPSGEDGERGGISNDIRALGERAYQLARELIAIANAAQKAADRSPLDIPGQREKEKKRCVGE